MFGVAWRRIAHGESVVVTHMPVLHVFYTDTHYTTLHYTNKRQYDWNSTISVSAKKCVVESNYEISPIRKCVFVLHCLIKMAFVLTFCVFWSNKTVYLYTNNLRHPFFWWVVVVNLFYPLRERLVVLTSEGWQQSQVAALPVPNSPLRSSFPCVQTMALLPVLTIFTVRIDLPLCLPDHPTVWHSVIQQSHTFSPQGNRWTTRKRVHCCHPAAARVKLTLHSRLFVVVVTFTW